MILVCVNDAETMGCLNGKAQLHLLASRMPFEEAFQLKDGMVKTNALPVKYASCLLQVGVCWEGEGSVLDALT